MDRWRCLECDEPAKEQDDPPTTCSSTGLPATWVPEADFLRSAGAQRIVAARLRGRGEA